MLVLYCLKWSSTLGRPDIGWLFSCCSLDLDFDATICGWNLLGSLRSPGASSFVGLPGNRSDQRSMALVQVANFFSHLKAGIALILTIATLR